MKAFNFLTTISFLLSVDTFSPLLLHFTVAFLQVWMPSASEANFCLLYTSPSPRD